MKDQQQQQQQQAQAAPPLPVQRPAWMCPQHHFLCPYYHQGRVSQLGRSLVQQLWALHCLILYFLLLLFLLTPPHAIADQGSSTLLAGPAAVTAVTSTTETSQKGAGGEVVIGGEWELIKMRGPVQAVNN
jgi:hypothetical protein